jgi:hypothetical protein
MWTFTNNGESSGLAQIFRGSSPFDDGGELEVLGGLPEGANIPFILLLKLEPRFLILLPLAVDFDFDFIFFLESPIFISLLLNALE